jgi:hypothetical protein
MKSLAIAEMMRRAFSRPGGTLADAGDDPALKRRAIVGLSRWDERGRVRVARAGGTPCWRI